MSKRAKKPPKKREQAWMAAARAKLHGKGLKRDEAEISEAFMHLVAPDLEELGRGASVQEVRLVLERVRFVWNLPILHALSTEPGSDGALIRADTEVWLDIAVDRQAMMPLFTERVESFGHLLRPITEVFAHQSGHRIEIGLCIGNEVVEAEAMLDIGDTGWPKASHCLLVLSKPVRDLLPDDYGLAEGEHAIALTVAAWNLYLIGRADDLVSDRVRRETLETAELARASPEPVRGAFEAMVQARRTHFGYDPRAIAGVSVSVSGDTIHVQAAAVASSSQMHGPNTFAVPAQQVKESSSWLSSVRRLVAGG